MGNIANIPKMTELVMRETPPPPKLFAPPPLSPLPQIIKKSGYASGIGFNDPGPRPSFIKYLAPLPHLDTSRRALPKSHASKGC